MRVAGEVGEVDGGSGLLVDAVGIGMGKDNDTGPGTSDGVVDALGEFGAADPGIGVAVLGVIFGGVSVIELGSFKGG